MYKSYSTGVTIRVFLIFLLLPLLYSCKDLFQFHPTEVRLDEDEKNLNARNLQKIQSLKEKDTIRFVLTGDSQRFYDEVDAFVSSVNRRHDVSFVLLAGDITDFGLNKEYRWIHLSLNKLAMPYIAVIGNHDLLANGRKVYQNMYGPEDFSFVFNKNKFICLNTNSIEFGFNGTVPNLPWLEQQLSDAARYNNVFVIAHVPPFSDAFDKNLEQPYASLLASAKTVRLSLYGHRHHYSQSRPYNDGVEYLVTASMNKREYTLITVWGEQYKIERISF